MDNNTRYLILGIIAIALIALIGLSYTLNNSSMPAYNFTSNDTLNATPTAGTAPEGNMSVTPAANVTTTPTGTPVPTAQ